MHHTIHIMLLLLLFNTIYSSTQTPSSPLTIISFNIRREGKEKEHRFLWQERKGNVVSIIKNHNADIIGLQEAGPNQINNIMHALGNNYAWYGVGRKQKGLINIFCSVDEHTPIIYRTDLFTFLNGGTFWLNPTMTPYKTGWGAFLNRICTWVALQQKRTGRIIYVFNTHLDNRTHNARTGGLQLILKQMEQITGDNPAILMGDFNAPTDIGDLQTILKKNHYQLKHGYNSALEKSIIIGTARTNVWSGNYKTIDHILFSNNMPTWLIHTYHAQWPTHNNMPVSDHAPIICHVSLLN